MILEAATLDVRPDQESAFEEAFMKASSIIASMPGYRGHELQRGIETTNRYIMLVRWDTL